MESNMLKNALFVLLMLCFIGLSAIATVQTVRIFYHVAMLQVEHDRMLAYVQP
jgi:hypothetical protein